MLDELPPSLASLPLGQCPSRQRAPLFDIHNKVQRGAYFAPLRPSPAPRTNNQSQPQHLTLQPLILSSTVYCIPDSATHTSPKSPDTPVSSPLDVRVPLVSSRHPTAPTPPLTAHESRDRPVHTGAKVTGSQVYSTYSAVLYIPWRHQPHCTSFGQLIAQGRPHPTLFGCPTASQRVPTNATYTLHLRSTVASSQ